MPKSTTLDDHDYALFVENVCHGVVSYLFIFSFTFNLLLDSGTMLARPVLNGLDLSEPKAKKTRSVIRHKKSTLHHTVSL